MNLDDYKDEAVVWYRSLTFWTQVAVSGGIGFILGALLA